MRPLGINTRNSLIILKEHKRQKSTNPGSSRFESGAPTGEGGARPWSHSRRCLQEPCTPKLHWGRKEMVEGEAF